MMERISKEELKRSLNISENSLSETEVDYGNKS